MKRSFRGNLKAVSPVIATIIIVAIAIVMSIAVAYWMLGLGGAFTRYEKMEFVSGYAVYNEGTKNFDIVIRVKNGGSADATLDLVFLNAKPSKDYTLNNTVTITPTAFIGATLKPGDETSATISLTRAVLLGDGVTWSTMWKSGMTVELMVQTVAGRQYPKVIVLP